MKRATSSHRLYLGGLTICALTQSYVPGRGDTSGCESFRKGGTWMVAMHSDTADFSLEGSITTGKYGRVNLTGISKEGTKEPINYPLDSFKTKGDSLHFQFAPLGIKIEGRCMSSDSIEAIFAFPQPPFPPIVGRGRITRAP